MASFITDLKKSLPLPENSLEDLKRENKGLSMQASINKTPLEKPERKSRKNKTLRKAPKRKSLRKNQQNYLYKTIGPSAFFIKGGKRKRRRKTRKNKKRKSRRKSRKRKRKTKRRR